MTVESIIVRMIIYKLEPNELTYEELCKLGFNLKNDRSLLPGKEDVLKRVETITLEIVDRLKMLDRRITGHE